MKIIYFGCDISLSVFLKLLELGHDISALYTYHNPHDLVHEFEIKAVALARGIPVYYRQMTAAEAEHMFASGVCDLFISAEYGAKLPIPPNGNFRGVNVHNSLLPEGKGFFTVETRRFLRLPYGGVTFHKLTPEYDEGDILAQEGFDLDPDEDIPRMYEKCGQVAAKLCAEIFRDDSAFAAHWEQARPQVGEASIWYPAKDERCIHDGMDVDEALHLFSCYDRFTFARTERGAAKARRVMAIHTGDPARALGRPLHDEILDFFPYALRDGTIWLALE